MHLVDARSPLIRRDLRGPIPEFTFDLTDLYGNHIQKARRTFSRPGLSRLKISDQLQFSPETRSITWQMITQADIAIKSDVVELKQDGATLYLRITTELPFEVKVVSLSPPPLAYDKNMEGLKRLEIQWKRTDFKSNSATLDVELETR
jgi:hypothetical protein